MSDNKRSSDKAVQGISSPITQILRSTPALPGESQEVYQQGLLDTIKELGASTPLQIYLAEKSMNVSGGCVATKIKSVPP